MMHTQKQKCFIHPNYDILYANISENYEGNSLLCPLCILKQQYLQDLIFIEEIVQDNQSLPIQNWPLGIKQDALDYLSLNPQIEYENLKLKIKTFYKDLTTNIFKMIEDQEIINLEKLESNYQDHRNLITFYNSAFKRNQLRQHFISQENFIENNYKELLRDIQQKRQMDLKELYQKIDSIKDIYRGRFNQSEDIKITLSNLIQNITFFPYSAEEQNEQMAIQNEDFNMYTLSSTLIQILKECSNFNMGLLKNNKSIQINFQKNKGILENMAKEINKYKDVINQMLQKTNQNSHQFQNRTGLKIAFEKSKLKNSELLVIGKDDNDNIYFTNLNQNIEGQYYSSNILNRKVSQIFRFKFNVPIYQCQNFSIGMLNEDMLDLYPSKSKLRIINNIKGDVQIIQGNFFENVPNKDQINEIEIRISLSDGIIQCSDYPGNLNIFQNINKIEQSINYRLGVFLSFQKNKIITLTHYHEEQKFIPFQ